MEKENYPTEHNVSGNELSRTSRCIVMGFGAVFNSALFRECNEMMGTNLNTTPINAIFTTTTVAIGAMISELRTRRTNTNLE